MQGQTVRVLPQRSIVALAIVFAASYALPQAQTSAKKVMGIDDYTKWRSISGSELSGDGNWVTYVLQLTNTPTTDAKPVLHLLKLETNEDVSVPNATGGTFSAIRSGSPTRLIRPVAVAGAVNAAQQVATRRRQAPPHQRRLRPRRLRMHLLRLPTRRRRPQLPVRSRRVAGQRHLRRRRGESNYAISPPAPCDRGRTFKRSRSRRHRPISS